MKPKLKPGDRPRMSIYRLPDEEPCTEIEWAEAVLTAVEVGMFDGTDEEHAEAIQIKAEYDKA